MTFPTPLMLALSAAVLAIDPSVPLPNKAASCLEESADHWIAVATYAEAFPKALAKRVGAGALDSTEKFDAAIDGLGQQIIGEAKELRAALAPASRG
jgi:hypothetical protein